MMIGQMRVLVLAVAVLLLSGCASTMKNMMVTERQSPYGLDETVDKITQRAKEKGWVVSGVKKMEDSIKKHGGPDIAPVRLVELCEPQHAAKLLTPDDTRYVSVMMPCTISVYTKTDGKVYVTTMNAGTLGGMLGGLIAEVMGGPVAQAQDYFVGFAK
jgi:uncharacterized protein (DUF302 family)